MKSRPFDLRFNGAATRRPRRVHDEQLRQRHHRMLQWGRDPEAAERPTRLEGQRLRIGGLQWGRDPEAAESAERVGQVPRGQGASMGPRPGGRGEAANLDLDSQVHVASMGPRPGGRGEGRRGECPPRPPRRFNGAATRRPRRVLRLQESHEAAPRASMGPRPGGRGETPRAPSDEGDRTTASMGPRPGGRGERGRRRRGGGRGGFNGAATRRPRRAGAEARCTE